jgi:RIO-like serine/threonine protein kinase
MFEMVPISVIKKILEMSNNDIEQAVLYLTDQDLVNNLIKE